MRKNLKKYLIDNDMSLKDLATDLNKNYSYISQVVNGDKTVSLNLIHAFKEKYKIKSFDEAIEIWKDE